MPKSCYIHIPFCNNICSYCDFSKLYYNENIVNRYLDSLDAEIKEYYKGDLLDTLYIGGGTPSSLSVEQLKKLFNILSVLKKSKNIEYTIEGNFDSTDKEKIDLYKKYGINRLSFGVESIDKDNLLFLERNLDECRVVDLINYSKSINIDNINVDLIYALPNETNEILQRDIDFILSLGVPHISTYSLIIEDNTKLKIRKVNNIDEDKDYDMYKIICENLKSHNYVHYEISNFSIDGYQSRHNTCYWNNDEYYGFGLGASSYIENNRITNTRSITKYLENDYIYEEEQLTLSDKIEYEIMLNLRKGSGINLRKFKEKFHNNLDELFDYNELISNKLLKLEKDNLFIPEDKWYISNEIIVRLLGSVKNEFR